MKTKSWFFFKILTVLVAITKSVSINAMDFLVETKAAYFYPIGEPFRKIYSGGALYGLEFDYQAWKQLYGWIDVNYFTKKGRTISDQDYTRLTMIPISIGLKYVYNKYKIQPYAGVGAETTYLQVHTNSPYLVRSNSNWGIGGIFKTGVLVYLYHAWFMDLHIDYSQMKVSMTSNKENAVVQDADLSGFAFGGSIGYGF